MTGEEAAQIVERETALVVSQIRTMALSGGYAIPKDKIQLMEELGKGLARVLRTK